MFFNINIVCSKYSNKKGGGGNLYDIILNSLLDYKRDLNMYFKRKKNPQKV